MATAGKPAASMTPSAAPFSAAQSVDLVFYSGNPRIEERRVVVTFHPDACASSSSFHLPVERKPRVCVLTVPNNMTYADFWRFCGEFANQALAMRIVSHGVDDKYSVLINFETQKSADDFYQHFNGKQFSPLEGHVCHVKYVDNVQCNRLTHHAHNPVTSSPEQHTCSVCCGQLEKDHGVMTTACDHSFHYTCLSKWRDFACPVCRYNLHESNKSLCSVCKASDNLFMCLPCGYVACGRRKDSHGGGHWKESNHHYAFELKTRKVWDYLAENYVHQSKINEKLVEYNQDAEMSEALLKNTCDDIVKDYGEFLRSQFESQRNYNECILVEIEEENAKQISAAVETASRTKFQKLQDQLDKAIKDKEFHVGVNDSLKKAGSDLEQQLKRLEARKTASTKSKDERIIQLKKERDELLSSFDGNVAKPTSADLQASCAMEAADPDPVVSAEKSNEESAMEATDPDPVVSAEKSNEESAPQKLENRRRRKKKKKKKKKGGAAKK